MNSHPRVAALARPAALPRHERPQVGVVLVAAGRGARLGGSEPKAFTRVLGRALIEFSIDVITALKSPGHLVVVVPESHGAEALELITAMRSPSPAWEISVVSGGRERHESVRFGLAALPESITTVLVHDAARPGASAELFERVVAEVLHSGEAVVPVLPVADTLKRVDRTGQVRGTVDRTDLVTVQTPQGFPLDALRAAHSATVTTAALEPHPSDAAHPSTQAHPTDDAEVVQRAGGTVRTIPGEVRAHKLTTPADLPLIEFFLGGAGNPNGSHP